MPRPLCCRWILEHPAVKAFKPAGIPAVRLREIAMTLDEYEALRLADREGLYQEEGAKRMGVSRPTFGRILECAHRKVAEALVDGCLLLIEGGAVHSLTEKRPDSKRGGQQAPCPRCAKGAEPPTKKALLKPEGDPTVRAGHGPVAARRNASTPPDRSSRCRVASARKQ